MPSGTAMTVARAVISIVPTIAGAIPPSPAGATSTGIELVRKDQLMTEAPLAITVTMTNPSGIIASTNASTISHVMIWFLARRQDGGSPRLTFCGPAGGCVVTAITYPVSVGRSGPRPHGR